MSIFDYQAAIKITFDKPIVTDPEIVTGTEYYKIPVPVESVRTFISTSDYSGYPKTQAFDRDNNTYWRANTTNAGEAIGKDFGQAVTLTKIGVQMDYSSGRINAYLIQGSDNGVDWNTVASGNFTDASGEQAVTFAATTYRYWRINGQSKFSSYYTVTELYFYGTRNTYSVAGWTVTGSEYTYQPEGATVAGSYTVRKVTKSEDDMSVILWLDMFDRMRDPAGLVTVAYDKLLGNLIGPYSAQVESFSVQFTPTNIVPYSNPNGRENLSALANMTVSVMEFACRYIPAESNTFLVPDQDNPYMDEHLSSQANMTVVVTNVGGLPL